MGDGESSGGPSPLEALAILASQEVVIASGLRHLEMYTMRGLLTVLWHRQRARTAPDQRPS